jgi:CHAT domain-containing protein/tetratricopeptide (TPR) repeat protein
MHRSYRRSLLSAVCAAALACAGLAAPAAHGRRGGPLAPDSASAAQARALFDSARAALRRNRADEALPQLESALALFLQAGDAGGAAAVRDQIGDIYLRHGQHGAALEQYRSAHDAFRAKDDCPNAALLLVKIGETHQLAGDAAAARAAFARLGDPNEKCGGNVGGAAGGGRRPESFVAIAAAMPSFAACSALGPNGPNNNNPGDAANNEPTLGHGPTPNNPSVRMDLRVVDQNGNPVKGVKAKLWSERQPNGFLCECEHYTDVSGKVLMDPIHLTKTLTLKLEAKGFEPQQLSIDPSALNRPFRAVMQAKGAAQQGAGQSSAAQQASAAAGALSCFDLQRLFLALGHGQSRLARDDYEQGRLDSARTRYEGLLAFADANAPTGDLLAARLFRAVARTGLADVAFKEGRFEEAARLYAQAAEGARKDKRLELAWAAQRGLGRSQWALAAQSGDAASAARRREESLQAFRSALQTVETLFAGSLRADEARTSFLSTTRDLFDDAAGALAEAALGAQPAPARPNQALAHAQGPRPLEGRALALAAEAFGVVERGRARSLLDLIGESRAEITEGVPAELVARRLANRARQQEIADELRGVRASSPSPAQPAPAATPQQTVAQLEAELERLGLEHDRIENEIRTNSPRYRAHVRAQPLTLAEVQRQVLDAGTALLEYNLGRERSYLFAVTDAGVTLHRLPARAEVEAQAVELRKHLIPTGARRAIAGIDASDQQRGIGEELQAATAGRGLVLGGAAGSPQAVNSYGSAAHALYRTAVAPAAPFVGARRLLVVPDGALHYVPFEALVSAPGGADFAGLNYLVKSNELVYAPSASVVAAVRSQARAAAPGGMLVVADPVFDSSDARARNRPAAHATAQAARRMALQSAVADVTSLKIAGLKLARLGGTRSEGERIAGLARTSGGAAELWLDFEASEANLRKRDLGRFGVLHFATHGLLDAERPQFTGLAFSLVGDAESDGFLRVEEVFNLRLGTPLVMLSACETGLGREKRGEGVIGLTRAFMYAGSPTVGVSLWSVADRSTAELMPEFYKRLLASQGRAPSAALRAAQRQMIEGRRFSAPFYWAPFVLVGDWR